VSLAGTCPVAGGVSLIGVPNRSTAFYAGLVVVLAAAGCQNQPVQPPPRWVPDSVPFGQIGAEDRSAAPPVAVRLAVEFKLLRVELPAGAVSDSDKLWNHLDEEAVGSGKALLLQRNGFRVGLGQPGDWAAVEAILRASQPALSKGRTIRLHGSEPLSIEDGMAARDQTVFYYRSDGTLVGQSIGKSRNVLRVDHHIDPQAPNAVALRVTPEIRQRDLGLRLVRTPAGLRKLPTYEGLLLDELSFGLRVAPGCFVLIAAGPRASQPALIGRQFMSCQGEQERYEFVYVIWPRLIRTEFSPA